MNFEILKKIKKRQLEIEFSLTRKLVEMERAQMIPLTPIEMRLCKLKKAGFTTAEIAKTCRLSPGTVRVYFTRIYKKLGRKEVNMLIIDEALKNQQPAG